MIKGYWLNQYLKVESGDFILKKERGKYRDVDRATAAENELLSMKADKANLNAQLNESQQESTLFVENLLVKQSSQELEMTRNCEELRKVTEEKRCVDGKLHDEVAQRNQLEKELLSMREDKANLNAQLNESQQESSELIQFES
eukprot:GHVR01140014.1.p1 GENE.GHVR01140014.1~~GHVR01140014.1.p1  ORF type:complete len:144 (-),score=17.12 GHVR01140014.1:193-624(-)